MSNIAKLGGTPMARPAESAEAILNLPDVTAVIVSGPGAREKDEDKVTDLLADYHLANKDHDEQQTHVLGSLVIERFTDAYEAHLGSETLAALQDSIRGGLVRRAGNLAATLALGEKMSSIFFGTAFDFEVKETAIRSSRGKYDKSLSHHSIRRQFEGSSSCRPSVIPGYYGYDASGRMFVFERGGSDRTGAIYAAALGADMYFNMTNIDGIHSGKPSYIEGTHRIPVLSQEEVRAGAHGGADVFNNDAVVDLGPTRARVIDAFDSNSRGTHILPRRTPEPDENPVLAVTSQEVNTVTIDDWGISQIDGYLEKAARFATQLGIPVKHMPCGEDAITFTVPASVPIKKLEEYRQRMLRFTINDDATVEISDAKSTVSLIGERLRKEPLIGNMACAEALVVLASNGIASVPIAHENSPSEVFLIGRGEQQRANQLLHDKFLATGKCLYWASAGCASDRWLSRPICTGQSVCGGA